MKFRLHIKFGQYRNTQILHTRKQNRRQQSEEKLKQIEEKLRQNEKLLTDRDNTIAGLYSDLYARETELNAASERIREIEEEISTEDTEYICSCCYERHTDQHPIVCTSSTPHLFCVSCINKRVKTAYIGKCNMPRQTISCFGLNCNHVITEWQLCRTVSGRDLICNCHFNEGMQHVIAMFKTFTDELNIDLPLIQQFMYKLMFINSDGTFRGYGCTKCGYGPLWHEHCGDLLTHHKQKVLNGHINNACPGCNHLFYDISDMTAWNG